MSAVANTRNSFCGMHVLEVARTIPTPILARDDFNPTCFERTRLQQGRRALTKEWASAPEEAGFSDQREVPQRLKPYSEVGVNGTAEAMPLQLPKPNNYRFFFV